jgi:large subunit ribosomal protein L10
MTAHVSDYKKKRVEELTKLVKEYSSIGIINMQGLPASQLQKMRSQLRADLTLVMAKKNIMKVAFEKSGKKSVSELEESFSGMPCLLFTRESPFKVALKLKKSKTAAAAKPGQTSPRDITIPAGPTSFTPGPILGELGQLGIKAGVDKGKIVIKEDKLVCRKGEKITAKSAALLQKFGIEPMEIGLNLVAFYDNGIIYGSEILDVDDIKLAKDIASAARGALFLAVEAGYPTKESLNMMIAKAYSQANAVYGLAKPAEN